jgi:hypothetical protein
MGITMTIEGKALLAVGKAQGELMRATRKLLAEDKHDGLKMAKWLAEHEKVFHAMREDYEGGALSDEELIAASKASGEKDYWR